MGVQEPAHGVGRGATVAGGQVANATGPFDASVIRHGMKRSAVAPAVWIVKWNEPRVGQPTSAGSVDTVRRKPGRPPSEPLACTTNANGALPRDSGQCDLVDRPIWRGHDCDHRRLGV